MFRDNAISHMWKCICKCSTRSVSLFSFLVLITTHLEEAFGLSIDHVDHTKKKTASSSHCTSPVKVFILAGQSNMQGHGYIDSKDEQGNPLNGTLEWMTEQDEYSDIGLTKNKRGEWTKRKDVWITYNKQFYLDMSPGVINVKGELTAGPYGGDPDDDPSMQMGPELGFGWTLGDSIHEQILLLKVAWGGKNLAVDFRPPSSGGKVGIYYEIMIQDIKTILTKIKTSLFPPPKSSSHCSSHEYNYEIAGFAWHQGWNDGINANFTREYEFNLANLVRDIRKDLNRTTLPISIGVSGMCGWNSCSKKDRTRMNDIIHAQFELETNANKYPEFAGTVKAVETRDFARKGHPYSPGQQYYHWMNNCESYWLVGKAMGNAMLELLRITPSKKGYSSLRAGKF